MSDEELVIDEPAPLALRQHIKRHNSQAITLALFSLVSAILLWGLVYLFAYWFTLVARTVSLSMNPETMTQITGRSAFVPRFPLYFLGGAVIALVLAWFARKWVQPNKLREAQYYILWVFAEILMAVPNVTFAIWGNLSAVVRLSKQEVTKAWRLLRRINEEGGQLSVATLRTVIEDEKTLNRVIFALQIVGLIGMREHGEAGWFLTLQNVDTVALLWPQVPPMEEAAEPS